MEAYVHKVQYYETDRMGITHHSNYIRWMEEARIDYLERCGWSYEKLEAEGIISPVLSVNCKYKESTTFADMIQIVTSVKAFNGVRLTIEYKMYKDIVKNPICIGVSEHCFLDKSGVPIRLKKDFPDFHQVLTQLAEKE